MLSPAFRSAENLAETLQEQKKRVLCAEQQQQDDSTKKASNDGIKVLGRDTNHASTDQRQQQQQQKQQLQRQQKHSDEDLIVQAEEHHSRDRLLAAARLLRTIKDPTLLEPKHRSILRTAIDCDSFVSSLKSSVDDTDSTWTKQGESHGKHDTIIYYKMGGDNGTHLTARVETPVPPSLLVPLLSVLNETELYRTWLPSWDKPRLGVTRSDKLSQTGRVSQTILVAADMPWPLAEREVVIRATAFDDIDASGDIAVRLKGLHVGNKDHGDGDSQTPLQIPPPKDRAVRVDFDGGFLFRKCPQDHPALQGRKGPNTGDGLADEKDLVLATFSMYVDAKIGFLPQSVVNFVVRTVLGRMWEMFLSVAEDVKEGRRPRHGEAIAAKRQSLYDWVDERVVAMLGRVCVSDDKGEDDVVTNSAEYLSYIQC